MNVDVIREIAARMAVILKEYEIEFETFQLSVRVPTKYYESIKTAFPDRHPVDEMIYQEEGNWSIKLIRPLFPEDRAIFSSELDKVQTTQSNVINPAKLKEIAAVTRKLLREEYQVEVEILGLQARVPEAYYQRIKENFFRHPIDMVVSASEHDWSISLMRFPTAQSKPINLFRLVLWYVAPKLYLALYNRPK